MSEQFERANASLRRYLSMDRSQPRGMRYLQEVLGVSSKKIHSWYTRRTGGFPEPVAYTRTPQYPGDRVGTPLWDVQEVVDWYSLYDPNARRGKHGKQQYWARKADC